ncbi:hypothetical protein Tco_1257445 [Tanacetum coccineum]
MFNMNKKTPKSKTPNSRLQPSASHLTPDLNFQLSGVSPPIRFRSPTFEYNTQLPQPPQNNNMFYQNRSFNPSYNNPNAFHNSLTGLYHHIIESSASFQPYQPYSPINLTNLVMNFEELMFSQEYNYSQDYSMGHGSGHGSAHGSAHGSVPYRDDEDDSPVEEVSPVKPKKPSRRATKAKKDETKEVKEPPKEWTVEEEIALCQGWCDVSENNISGSMKAKGFWEAVIRYFEKQTGSTRANHESGTNDLDVYQKACAEFKMIYKGDFNLEHCYNIMKDHPGGINLNEEADEAVQETQEFRPMGRDMEMNNRELNIQEAEAREIAQLKREKLEIQRRMLELAEREKRDRDILFYNSIIDTNLLPIQQQKLLEIKMEIKERYNLDY